jgi:hypothetical protein
MDGIFKKSFMKWSMISALGLGAYFIGFSLGSNQLQNTERLQAARESEETVEPLIFLPTSEKTTNLSQLK